MEQLLTDAIIRLYSDLIINMYFIEKKYTGLPRYEISRCHISIKQPVCQDELLRDFSQACIADHGSTMYYSAY